MELKFGFTCQKRDWMELVPIRQYIDTSPKLLSGMITNGPFLVKMKGHTIHSI